MASSREIRRLAFQALFQLDARGGPKGVSAEDGAVVRESLNEPEGYTDGERDAAFRLALDAYNDRKAADAVMVELAPAWPVHRQAAVDRAILRLSHFEMTHAGTRGPSPKITVNEAVELAKAYSTDKSPAFINALLDKVLKRLPGDGGEAAPERADPAVTEGAGGAEGDAGGGGGGEERWRFSRRWGASLGAVTKDGEVPLTDVRQLPPGRKLDDARSRSWRRPPAGRHGRRGDGEADRGDQGGLQERGR